MAKGKLVTIYTDSRYAFGVVHDFGALWQYRNFLTSSGKHIAHHTLISDLPSAIMLPSTVAVCKCQAHTRAQDVISRGNARADAAAKSAAHLPLSKDLLLSHSSSDFTSPAPSLFAMQSLAAPEEHRLCSASGSSFTDGVWIGPTGKPCLLKHFFRHDAKLTHGKDHVSKGGTLTALTETWHQKRFSDYAENLCQSCITCATHNVGRAVPVTSQAAHAPPTQPFEHLRMDFVELTPPEGKSHCLVMVDMWLKRVEAFRASKQTASVVSKAVQTDTGLPWTKVLPIVLMYMRMRKRARQNLSPFEILFAAPPNIGLAPQRLLCCPLTSVNMTC